MLGETDCLEYEGMAIYCGKDIEFNGVSYADNPYIACLSTTKKGIEGLDGIRVGDSIKKLRFSVSENLKDTVKFVYAYTKDGSRIENPTLESQNYDDSYCMIEYSNVEGSGRIRFINDWKEVVITYNNLTVSEMLINAIIP